MWMPDNIKLNPSMHNYHYSARTSVSRMDTVDCIMSYISYLELYFMSSHPIFFSCLFNLKVHYPVSMTC